VVDVIISLSFYPPCTPAGKDTGDVDSSGSGLQPPSMSPSIGRV
jgi:hypothetical protein